MYLEILRCSPRTQFKGQDKKFSEWCLLKSLFKAMVACLIVMAKNCNPLLWDTIQKDAVKSLLVDYWSLWVDSEKASRCCPYKSVSKWASIKVAERHPSIFFNQASYLPYQKRSTRRRNSVFDHWAALPQCLFPIHGYFNRQTKWRASYTSSL